MNEFEHAESNIGRYADLAIGSPVLRARVTIARERDGTGDDIEGRREIALDVELEKVLARAIKHLKSEHLDRLISAIQHEKRSRVSEPHSEASRPLFEVYGVELDQSLVRFQLRGLGQHLAERVVTEADLDRAQLTYRTLRDHLEADYMDKFVAIDVDDGTYVIADRRLAAQALHKQKFGEHRVSCTFHIGTTR